MRNYFCNLARGPLHAIWFCVVFHFMPVNYKNIFILIKKMSIFQSVISWVIPVTHNPCPSEHTPACERRKG